MSDGPTARDVERLVGRSVRVSWLDATEIVEQTGKLEKIRRMADYVIVSEGRLVDVFELHGIKVILVELVKGKKSAIYHGIPFPLVLEIEPVEGGRMTLVKSRASSVRPIIGRRRTR